MQVRSIDNLLNLQGKTAIVTGGAKGIGLGISYRLAEAGARVLIADIDEMCVDEAAKELRQKGWKAEGIYLDVSSEEAVRLMIEACSETCDSLDILVNNAGIYPQKPLGKMNITDFTQVLDVNLKGVFLTTKYAAAIMKKQESGKIINITSIDAIHPSMAGLAHYDASKHGVWGFTKNIALELAAFNIQVNAIAPGGIKTPGVAAMQHTNKAALARVTKKFLEKIPMMRMGEPDEIGKVALFLASDMASYITGAQIVVDGGALLS